MIPRGDKQSSNDYVSALDEELVNGGVIAPRKPGAKIAHFIRDEPKLWNKLGLLKRDGAFVQAGFARKCWANADPIRAIFKASFERAGLSNFNPHSFRKTLVRHGLDLGIDEAGLVAWSQNLGHENIHVTLKSYGRLSVNRQRDLIRAAAHSKDDDRLALELGRKALAAARANK